MDKGDEESVQYLPATIVKAIKKSKEAGVTHLMHFDDGDFEKVGLPDPGITFDIAESVVSMCKCLRCTRTSPGGRALPLP